MKWATPKYQIPTEYNQAAKVLLATGNSAEFRRVAGIVSNWRASHAYPLHAITMVLRRRVDALDSDGLVVQRQKRLASIIPKLSRMRLTQIQDIGGYRAVLTDLENLNKVHDKYMRSASRENISRPYMDGAPDNYIDSPKSDGYRGIHYVFRYRSRFANYEIFNGMKIEIQLRTKMQHAWATSVEIVDLFTGENLKTDIYLNRADPNWKRFFQLMGSVIALEEKCPTVQNTPEDMSGLIVELKPICTVLDAVPVLEGYGAAFNRIYERGISKGGDYLLVIDTKKRVLNIKLYAETEREQLDKDYLATETSNISNSHIQVAQVNARSLVEFKRAYPNYDLDTRGFVRTLRKALAS